ncbi:MAG: hypothetical protein AB7V04_10940 [Desulfomonilaceae bacterium]
MPEAKSASIETKGEAWIVRTLGFDTPVKIDDPTTISCKVLV